MKRWVVVLICGLWSVSAGWADNGWGLFGSYWMPQDGDSEFGPGMRVAIEIIPGMQLDLRASYFNNVMEKNKGPDLTVVPLEAGLGMIAPVVERLRVYGGLGAGYYLMDSAADVNNKLGYFANGGVEFIMMENRAVYGGTRASLFAEGMYRAVTAKDAGPDGDVELNGPVLNAGLMVRW